MKNAKAVTEFGHRLTSAMKAKGYISTGAKSGVDVNALARATETSYEMARRYAEGMAIPRPDKLAKIAEWLGTAPATLLYGEVEQPTSRIIHTEVLESCLEAAARAEQLAKQKLDPEKMAKLVALLYEEAVDGRTVNTDLITRLLRLL